MGFSSKNSSNYVKWFLFRKLMREFRLPYLRAFANYVLFAVIHRLEGITPLKLTRHRFLKPVALLVQVNKVCNFSCAFCFVNELNEKGAKEFDVSPETFEKMLGQPVLNSLLRLGFTGGEPLLHMKLFDYIEKARETIPSVSINTNFALAGRTNKGERNIDRLNRSSLDMITISLYERNVKEIEEFAPQLNPKIFKRLSFVVSQGKDAFHSFERMHEVTEMAVRLGFHCVYFQNFDSMEGVKDQNANLNKMDISGFKAVTQDEKYLAMKVRIQKDFGDKIAIAMPVPKKKPETLLKSFNCYQPDFQIGVDGKGNLSPCCNLDRSPEFGNLFTEDNWNNKSFQLVREGIKSKNMAPAPFCAGCTFLDINFHEL